jgi:hypothetical protein
MMKTGKSNRKAQIFSLDVLITLIPILLILGASAQYIFNTQEAFRSSQQDIELTSISRMVLNTLVAEMQSSGERFEDVDVITRAEALASNENYYYFTQFYYDGINIARSCVSDDYWSSGLDERSPQYFRNTTGSWKRFVLAPNWEYPDASGNPQFIANITEVSLALWK